jgi:phosphonate transport system ATP-binding protein
MVEVAEQQSIVKDAETVSIDAPQKNGKVDLQVEGLSKSFDGKRAILKDISFKVANGEAVALIGSNGAGKSTLLRCCLRLVEPDAGSIKLLETDIRALKKRELRRTRSRVGFIFQKHNLVPRLSVLTNVVHGAQSHSASPALWYQWAAPQPIREEAMHCLDLVGLAHLAEQKAQSLSGGESQRVAIARALMQCPRIIFADEPSASLDPSAGEEVMGLFYNLLNHENVTFVHTSHNLEHAIAYSDRVLGLQNGLIELDASSDRLNSQELRGIYD